MRQIIENPIPGKLYRISVKDGLFLRELGIPGYHTDHEDSVALVCLIPLNSIVIFIKPKSIYMTVGYEDSFYEVLNVEFYEVEDHNDAARFG